MFKYQFSNQLGTTFTQGGSGALQFSKDGYALLLPQGNRVQLMDLQQNRSLCLEPQNRKDNKIVALLETNSNGNSTLNSKSKTTTTSNNSNSNSKTLLLTIDNEGHSLLINLRHQTILTRMNFKRRVKDAKWSPNGRYLAITKGRLLELWRTPGCCSDEELLEIQCQESGDSDVGDSEEPFSGDWQFHKIKTLGGHRGDITKIEWSGCSRYLLTASEDMQVRLYSMPVNQKVLERIEKQKLMLAKKNENKNALNSKKRANPDKKESDAESDQSGLDSESEEDESDDEESENENSESEESSESTSTAETAKKTNKSSKKTDINKKERLGRSLSGRTGILTGFKGKTTYDGFVPMIFSELRQAVKGAYFNEDNSTVFTVCKDGVVAIWKYQVEDKEKLNNTNTSKSNSESYSTDIDLLRQPGAWSCASKTFLNLPNGNKIADTCFNRTQNILLAGLTGGVFALYELLPKVAMLHTLSMGTNPVDSLQINSSGEWIAAGSSTSGQLLVWEWRSETYILKQEGYSWGISACAFSPSSGARRDLTLKSSSGSAGGGGVGSSLVSSGGGGNSNNMIGLSGSLLATGGNDGRIKLWNTISGFCNVTFTEHTGRVNDICFTPQGNAILSCSADGSVRAYDLMRFRNFRTMVAPPEVAKGSSNGSCQLTGGFESLAVDSGGEIVAASVKGEQYLVLVWSLQTGKILEVLSGAEAPVSCLTFNTNPSKAGELITGSWDGNLTVQNLFKRAKGSAPEKLQCGGAIMAIAADPRGNDIVAASSLAGNIIFWDVENAQIRGTIEGIRDIVSGRDSKSLTSVTNSRGKNLKNKKEKYKFSIEYVDLNQHFSSIKFSASGNILLCCSKNSAHVCLYSTSEFVLIQKYSLTENQSLGNLKSILNNSKHLIEGDTWAEHDVSDDEDEDFQRKRKRIDDSNSLPGVVGGSEFAAHKAYSKNQFHCAKVDFSGDGKSFAVATTHGVFHYELDLGFVSSSERSVLTSSFGTALERFRPAILSKNVTIPSIIKAIKKENNVTKGFILALALNDARILTYIYEELIPISKIPEVVMSIGSALLPTLLHFLSCLLDPQLGSPCIQKHNTWIQAVLEIHTSTLLSWTAGQGRPMELNALLESEQKKKGLDGRKGNDSSNNDSESSSSDSILTSSTLNIGELQATLLRCMQRLSQHQAKLQKVFEKNSFSLEYLTTMVKESSE